MSGNHPKLVLDGIKTMTRRVIDFGRFFNSNEHFKNNYKFEKMFYDDRKDENVAIFGYKPVGDKYGFAEWFKCPYGQVGDRLYLKESHNLTTWFLEGEWWIKAEYRFDYKGDDGIRWFRWADIPEAQRKRLSRMKTWGKWRSSRFMYKFLARIWLQITEVRVERVQEITEADAIAEGVEPLSIGGYNNYLWHGTLGLTRKQFESWPYQYSNYKTAKDSFSSLWDSLNAKRGYGWEVNPWVWAISFKRVE